MKIPFEKELKTSTVAWLSAITGFCIGIVYSPHVSYHQAAVQDVAAVAEMVDECASDLRDCQAESEDYRTGETFYSSLYDDCFRDLSDAYRQIDADAGLPPVESIDGVIDEELLELLDPEGARILDEMEEIGRRMDENIEIMERAAYKQR
jgi:hypothetical protein